MDPGGRGCGEELGGVEGGKIVIRVYCMRKESIFDEGVENGFLQCLYCNFY